MISEDDVHLSSAPKKSQKEKATFHPGCELPYMFKVWGVGGHDFRVRMLLATKWREISRKWLKK